MNSGAAMEYVTPRNVTNRSTDGNGVLCGSTPIVTSWNNTGIVGSGVFCWVHPESISQVPTGPVESLEKSRDRLKPAVSSWQTDPSEVDSCPWRWPGSSHCCKSLRSNTELWASRAGKDVKTEAEESTALEAVTRQAAKTVQTEKT
jgi:hypothetical protein